MPINVAKVEDDRRFLENLCALLRDIPSVKISGLYSTGKEAVKGITEMCPEVALVDLGLPDISGVDVIREVSNKGCNTEMLVLTVYNDDDHLFPAIKAGATGYIVKDEASHSSEVPS